MEAKKVFVVCKAGGVFEQAKDGSFSYRGGNARAFHIEMKFDKLKTEVAKRFGAEDSTVFFKYFFFKTLVTVSNDEDPGVMIEYHRDSEPIELYLIIDEIPSLDISDMQSNRQTTLPEAMAPADPSLPIEDNQVDDILSEARAPAGVSSSIPDQHMGDDFESHPGGDPNNAKLAKASQRWKNTITGVGQTFNSALEIRESLRKHAISHQFAFRYKKNDNLRVIVVCKSDGCPWSIRASRLSTSQLFRIKKMSPVHTCDGAVGRTTHQGISRLVAGIIKEKLKESPRYRPKDIANDIKQEYRIQLTPLQASRAKEMAKKDILTEEYSQLAFLCEKIIMENPRNLATLTSRDDLTLKSLFCLVPCFLVWLPTRLPALSFS